MPPIEAKQAVKAAVAYVADLFKDENVGDVLLEELELSSDERFWLVTVSILRAIHNPFGVLAGDLSKVLGPTGKRVYKSVHVDAYTGAVRKVKIRDLGAGA